MILVGPGKHFGAEIINRFSNEGFAVGVISPHQSTLDLVRRAVADESKSIEYIVGDVARSDEFFHLTKDLSKRLGRIECVIYNPKASFSGSGLRLSTTNLNNAMAVNLTGALTTIQAFSPMLSRSARANIIVTGGAYKDRPDTEKFALSVGKAALHGLVRALTDPLARQGIALKTVVIDGAIRRDAKGSRSSEMLAEFYWNVFNALGRSVFRYPPPVDEDISQLELPM